jgi:hypothetical protein
MGPEGVRRGGGRLEAPLQLAQERLFPHHTQYFLVVDDPPLPPESLRDPTIAITGELKNDPLCGIPERNLLPRPSLRFSYYQERLTPNSAHSPLERHLGVLHGGLFDHGVPLVEWYLSSPFFKISFFRASLPQNLRNSATFCSRASPSESCFSVKAASPHASYPRLHFRSTLCARLCFRRSAPGASLP